MKRTLLATLTIAALGLPALAQRETAEASYAEGKVSISYGSPTWRDEFATAMAKEKVWRLGSNDPTAVKLSCGLMTNDGAIPAGDYKLAMRRGDDGKWNLVIYSGNGFYAAGQDGWGIKPAIELESENIAKKLAIKLNEKKLEVHFGPKAVVFPFMPVGMHKTVETEFARIPTKIQVMAIPVDGDVKNLFVGTSSVESRGAKVAWNMYLTVANGKSSLAFKSTRSAKAIDAEAKQITGTIKRIKDFMGNAGEDRKAQLQEAIKQREATLKELEAEKTAMNRFRSEHSVDGETAASDAPKPTLGFEHKRIEGGLILKFTAGKNTSTFDINPREFFNR